MLCSSRFPDSMPVGGWTTRRVLAPQLCCLTTSPWYSAVSREGCPRPARRIASGHSMRTMRTRRAGFRLELVVAEPDVESGCHGDRRGRSALRRRDAGVSHRRPPTEQGELLEDPRPATAGSPRSVFADELVPTGVMRWSEGILACPRTRCAVLRRHGRGQGRPTCASVISRGFARSPQRTVNSPGHGLDNWVYVAHQGPRPRCLQGLVRDRGKPADVSGKTPNAHRWIEGRTDWLSQARSSSRSSRCECGATHVRCLRPIRQRQLASPVARGHRARYLQRNPQLLVLAVMHDVPDHGAAAQVFRSRSGRSSNS